MLAEVREPGELLRVEQRADTDAERSRGLLSRSSLLGSLLCCLGLLRCILISLFSLGPLRRQILGSLVELVGISLSLL